MPVCLRHPCSRAGNLGDFALRSSPLLLVLFGSQLFLESNTAHRMHECVWVRLSDLKSNKRRPEADVPAGHSDAFTSSAWQILDTMSLGSSSMASVPPFTLPLGIQWSNALLP
jgi:hypothetical protein